MDALNLIYNKLQDIPTTEEVFDVWIDDEEALLFVTLADEVGERHVYEISAREVR